MWVEEEGGDFWVVMEGTRSVSKPSATDGNTIAGFNLHYSSGPLPEKGDSPWKESLVEEDVGARLVFLLWQTTARVTQHCSFEFSLFDRYYCLLNGAESAV